MIEPISSDQAVQCLWLHINAVNSVECKRPSRESLGNNRCRQTKGLSGLFRSAPIDDDERSRNPTRYCKPDRKSDSQQKSIEFAMNFSEGLPITVECILPQGLNLQKCLLNDPSELQFERTDHPQSEPFTPDSKMFELISPEPPAQEQFRSQPVKLTEMERNLRQHSLLTLQGMRQACSNGAYQWLGQPSSLNS